MSVRPSTWGAIVGVVFGLLIVGGLSVVLLDSGGVNYKVLVAPWLWLLPVTGSFAGLGFAGGKTIEIVARRGLTRRGRGL